MEHILNLRSIVRKMKEKPKSQRMYYFFWGTPNQLSVDQMKDIKSIVEKEHRQMVLFLDKAISAKKKQKAA